jgi:hypothetical protein
MMLPDGQSIFLKAINVGYVSQPIKSFAAAH